MRSARWIWFGLSLAGVSASLGCEDLSPIAGGKCGNAVVDDETEDCDTFGTGSTAACGKPSSERGDACRFLCGDQQDGTAPTCPAGFKCGPDSICRTPLEPSEFREVGEPLEEDIYQIQLADFDGDKRLDVLTGGVDELRVRYFDDAMRVAAVATIPSFFSAPTIGQLTQSDEQADFAFRVGPGVGVILGQKDRTLTSMQYPFELVHEKTDVTIIVLDSLPDALNVDEALIMFRDATGAAKILSPVASLVGDDTPFFVNLDGLIEFPQHDVATGDVIKSNPCEDIVIAHRGTKMKAPVGRHGLLLIEPCEKKSDAPGFEYAKGDTVDYVFLPEDHEVRTGPKIADLDGDGELDLIVGATMPCKKDSTSTTCCAMEVAYGVSLGGFSSKLDSPTADNRMSPVGYPEETLAGECPAYDPNKDHVLMLPLAIGDLNGDGTADYVDPEHIWMGSKTSDAEGKKLTYSVASPAGPWSSAVIGDFNRDDTLDIVGGNILVPGLDFYQGAVGPKGELMTPLSAFRIPTTQPPHHLTVGNFDGDLVADIAMSEFSSEGRDALSVAFGRPLDVPAPPIVMGRLGTIAQLTSGTLSRFTYEKDYITDLVAVSARALDPGQQQGASGEQIKGSFQEDVLLYSGTTDRFLQSPVRLKSRKPGGMMNAVDMGGYPYRIAVGHFAGDSHIDIAALALEVELQAILDPEATKSAKDDVGLWLLPGKVNAEFELPDPKAMGKNPASLEALRAPALAGMKSGDLAMVALNLDDDELDELLIFVPVPDTQTSTTLLFRADAMDRFWSIAPAVALFAEGSPMATWKTTARASADDVNGDDKKDVVVLFKDATEALETHLVVFWNEGNGISAASMTELTTPVRATDGQADYPVAYALLDADRDADKELAVLTRSGTYLVEVGKGSPPSLSKPVAIAKLPGGTSIAAGDLTGDGLDDLVIGGVTGGSVWENKPELE